MVSFVTDGTVRAAASCRRSGRGSAGTFSSASVGRAARSSIFMEKPRAWTALSVCISEARDATTLIREFRPLGFAASDRRRRDQSAATRGALCTCVKRLLLYPFSLLHPRPSFLLLWLPCLLPRSLTHPCSSLYSPVIQHDGGCVHARASPPTTSSSTSSTISPFPFLTLSPIHIHIPCRFPLSLFSLPPCLLSLGSVLRRIEGCTAQRSAVTLFLSASTKGGVRSIAFDCPYWTFRCPYWTFVQKRASENKLVSRWTTDRRRTTCRLNDVVLSTRGAGITASIFLHR